MLALQIAIFLLVSAGLVYVSRASLRRPRGHGFWRFWAWEAIAALIVLNAPVWFRDPPTLAHIANNCVAALLLG